MTGLYKESIKVRKAKARADLNKVRHSLSTLVHKKTEYADEHRALIAIFEKVLAVYESAPEELTK